MLCKCFQVFYMLTMGGGVLFIFYRQTTVFFLLLHSFHISMFFSLYSHCMETAQYLRDKITEAGLTCRLNDLSSTVVLERPMDDKVIKRWQLACEEDIAHVVVMPNVTKFKIDKFVEELVECKNKHGRMKPVRADSPLTKLESSSWGGSAVAPVAATFHEEY
jgi:hypothetical protein